MMKALRYCETVSTAGVVRMRRPLSDGETEHRAPSGISVVNLHPHIESQVITKAAIDEALLNRLKNMQYRRNGPVKSTRSVRIR